MKSKTMIARICFFISTFFAFYAISFSQSGKVFESIEAPSATLGMPIKFTIYLPADYDNSKRTYPVLYLLHGYSDNENAWVQFGEVNHTADKLFAAGEAAPCIIVMPNAGESWYINSFDGKVRYEDAFFNDFIPYIEKTYRIKSKKEFRAIAGLSMGGYGALLYTLKHTDMFTACMPFSAAIRNDSLMKRKLANHESNTENCFGTLKENMLSETWKLNDVLTLAKTLPEENLKSVTFYFDCGDKDGLVFGNSLMHFTLMNRAIPHEFRVRGGIHEWKYWRQSIEDGLIFLAPAFRR